MKYQQGFIFEQKYVITDSGRSPYQAGYEEYTCEDINTKKKYSLVICKWEQTKNLPILNLTHANLK